MKVHLINVKGLAFIGRGESNHWIPLDGEKEFGGYESGIRPMETLLVSLGSCTGMDVSSILRKMGVKYSSFEIDVNGERVQEHPKVFTRIHITYRFRGMNLPMEKLNKAVTLSQEKYCPISAMLRKVADLSWEIKVEED